MRETPGKQKRAFTAYGRQKMFTQKMSDSMRDIPGPQYLLNDRHLYSTLGMTNCSFTDADRLDLSAPANFYPGSQYLIQGFTDRFKVSRKKNCPDWIKCYIKFNLIILKSFFDTNINEWNHKIFEYLGGHAGMSPCFEDEHRFVDWLLTLEPLMEPSFFDF